MGRYIFTSFSLLFTIPPLRLDSTIYLADLAARFRFRSNGLGPYKFETIRDKRTARSATNSEIYGGLPRVTETIRGRRMRLVGHIEWHNEIIAMDLLLLDPLHGCRGLGRPKSRRLPTPTCWGGITDSRTLQRYRGWCRTGCSAGSSSCLGRWSRPKSVSISGDDWRLYTILFQTRRTESFMKTLNSPATNRNPPVFLESRNTLRLTAKFHCASVKLSRRNLAQKCTWIESCASLCNSKQ